MDGKEPPSGAYRGDRLVLSLQGQAGWRLLASGLGDEDTGGGLFAFDGTALEKIDRVSTTGLFMTGSRLLRSPRNGTTENASGEIIVYDGCGVERYYRLDLLPDIHDLNWDGERFVAVSSTGNLIAWVSECGRVDRVWRAPGEIDSWHLNAIVQHEGRLFACCFGRYHRYREWKERLLCGDGVVFDLESGQDLLTGLCAPHTPRYLDGAWVVCNSARFELLRIEPPESVVRRIELRSFTRGLAATDELLFVGESAHRSLGRGDLASIAVLDRRTWELVGRIELPCREVYDLALAPPELYAGVKAGFRTNAVREHEQNQLALFDQLGIAPARLWATGDPLPAQDCRVAIRAGIPERVGCGSSTWVDCEIENLGNSFLVSAPPNPVHVSYRWWSDSRNFVEGSRTVLPRALAPRSSFPLRVRLQAPAQPGEYILKLTAVQELVAWFDDLDPSNACVNQVRVE